MVGSGEGKVVRPRQGIYHLDESCKASTSHLSNVSLQMLLLIGGISTTMSLVVVPGKIHVRDGDMISMCQAQNLHAAGVVLVVDLFGLLQRRLRFAMICL